MDKRHDTVLETLMEQLIEGGAENMGLVFARVRLQRQVLFARSLCEPDTRRARQCIADHPRHGLRADRQTRRDDHRGPWHPASDHLYGRSAQADSKDQPHQQASRIVTGTKITVRWPEPDLLNRDDLARAALHFHWMNPHLTLVCDIRGWSCECPALDPAWRKWLPKNPTSPHWYDVARIKNLIAKTVAHADDHGELCPTVRDFLSDFAGLARTAPRATICAALGVSRSPLSIYVTGSKIKDVPRLLNAMKAESIEIRPRDLGVIGEANLREHFAHNDTAMGTFRYKLAEIVVDGVPYLAEAAFAYLPEMDRRCLVTGLNWSITVGGNPFRTLVDEETGLDGFLSDQWASSDEPVLAFLHVVSPRFEFHDKGKTSLTLPEEVNKAVCGIVAFVTEKWAKQRRQEERNAAAQRNRLAKLSGKDDTISIKEAAYEVMSDAYAKVSNDGELPANARQIMYAARREIFELTQKAKMTDNYFTQVLLVDYINEHPEECADWNVVYSDRGHFREPHTNEIIGLGTLAVRDYIEGYADPSLIEAGFKNAVIKTHGPNGRYGALLYIEKEGFDPLIDAARISERFDIACFSCKGMSVTAARELVDRTCAEYGLPLFIMHDFDVSGFSIKTTLHTSNRRYTLETEGEFPVYDIGLRLEDIRYFEEEGEPLESEPVTLKANKYGEAKETRRDNLAATVRRPTRLPS